MNEKRPKKPFGQTKIGGFLKELLVDNSKRIPVVGGIVENIIKPEGGKGKIVFDTQLLASVIGGLLLLTILENLGVLNTGVTQFFVDVLNSLNISTEIATN